ncbi:MAG: L-histidine N(alpha)-methyltransferase [Cytophagales bacterium]|nr:L-histidine N(alpha)-methyltransferase [Cytophagales bacterium]
MQTAITTEFATDVMRGLRSSPKRLSSKYFYDDEGSRIFKKIMHLPEYYLTRCETEIFEQEKETWLRLFDPQQTGFELIELGAGDGLKTKILLKHFLQQKARFTYVPIDISAGVLTELADNLHNELPQLSVKPTEGDYFTALQRQLSSTDAIRRVVLFLGSNIGNFSESETIWFFQRLKDLLLNGDLLLLGFDLQKHPSVILAAYNDAQGVTREFNLNLLRRLNRELQADFDLSQFDHYPLYDPSTGEARSYLVSRIQQTVRLDTLGETVQLEAGECIHTEISRKYTLVQMRSLAQSVGLQPLAWFTDSKDYFTDMLLEIRK